MITLLERTASETIALSSAAIASPQGAATASTRLPDTAARRTVVMGKLGGATASWAVAWPPALTSDWGYDSPSACYEYPGYGYDYGVGVGGDGLYAYASDYRRSYGSAPSLPTRHALGSVTPRNLYNFAPGVSN